MKHQDMRRRIAHAAARILAEEGALDYGTAKWGIATKITNAIIEFFYNNKLFFCQINFIFI